MLVPVDIPGPHPTLEVPVVVIGVTRRTPAAPPLPILTHDKRRPSGRRGLSLRLLRAIREFYREHGGIDKVMGDVCKEAGFAASVCALTRSTGLSLAESVVHAAESSGASSAALVGHATTFFSYSWTGTRLGDMLDAVEGQLERLEAADGRPRFVWIDMFCASQNLLAGVFEPDAHPRGSAERAARKEDTDHIFGDALEAVGELLLYCSPLSGTWLAPPHPYLDPARGEPPERWERRGPGAITRAWCLFEMGECLAKGYPLHVVLSPADVEGFAGLLTERFDEIAGIVASIDARDAQISKAEDREYILAQVNRVEGGLGGVTKAVCAALRAWLAREGRAALARLPAAERGTSVLINQLGSMLKDQGKLEAAGALYREALQARRETLGDKHLRTLTAISNLGALLQAQGKLEEAAPLLREALQASRETLGDKHPDTLSSLNNLGSLLEDQGKLEEAGALMREALQVRRETLGDKHPKTLSSLSNLGLLLQAQGKLEEAAPLYREALQARRETLGDRHPDTLISIWNLCTLLDQGEEDEAKRLCREAVDGAKAVLGTAHPHTKIFMSNSWGIR